MSILGLVFLACVVLSSCLQTWNGPNSETTSAVMPLDRQRVQNSAEVKRTSNQIARADRIAVVDDDSQSFPIQPASHFDAQVWNSELATQEPSNVAAPKRQPTTEESKTEWTKRYPNIRILDQTNEMPAADQVDSHPEPPEANSGFVPNPYSAHGNHESSDRAKTDPEPPADPEPKDDAFVSQGTRITNPYAGSAIRDRPRLQNTQALETSAAGDFPTDPTPASSDLPTNDFPIQSTDLNGPSSLNEQAQSEPIWTVSAPPSARLPQVATGEADNLPSSLRGADHFVLAEQPKLGAIWKDDGPITGSNVCLIDPIESDFSPDPIRRDLPFDPYAAMEVYEGKTLNANQRPIVELGRPWYQLGQLSPGSSWLGKHNNVTPQFLLYGDTRTAAASNTQAGENVSQIAFELNLDFDLKLTSTERFHMFMSPLDNGVENARWLIDDGEFIDQYDANIDFGYFEGDLGAIVGGFTNQTLPFDLPFTLGVIPMFIQNGVWMEDAFLGFAATVPARNSPRLNIANMDVTFFAGYDKLNSDAFLNDDSAARIYGLATFIDAMNGYFEIDYAFLDDRTFDDRSYHNIGLAFTRRYGRFLSNSTRLIVNAGQSTDVVANSADGVLLLSENSLITGAPSTLVPYFNLFAGFDRPQSAARAVQAGGVLRNTGILFETDGMTQYPTLNATANDTYGGALGINLIADDFSQQLVVEMAVLGVMGEEATRNTRGPQYGLGFRYQLPLTNALILRADGMLGFLEDDQDLRGLRMELRHKY